jgi:succinoglycan biosynthesis protein ExoM
MLLSCLESLASQLVPYDLRPFIIVVDNELEPNNEAAVLEFEKTAPYEIAYWHEPRRGIAIARNTALRLALEFGAQWIAFIDDDEIAEPDWLASLMAPEYLDTSIVSGLNLPLYPDLMPFWVRVKEYKAQEGQSFKTAYTGNVRFSIDLVKAGLRFDEGLGLMGGEDNEL